MKSFNVVAKPIHYFDVFVPNFSTVNTWVLEIDYFQYKLMAKPSFLLRSDDTEIFIDNNIIIETEVSEMLDLPIEIKSESRIDTEALRKYIYSSEVLKDVPIHLKNKVNAEISSKEPISTTIKSKLTIEMEEPIVAELIKLYEIDDLAWEDLDGKALEEIYYKTTI